MRVLPVYVCVCKVCGSGACRGQKRGSDHLELEVQMVVNHHEGVGTETRSCGRATNTLNH